MSRIYLLRHGEPGTRGVLLGQNDAELSVAGRLFASHLVLPRHAAAYSSPLRRCLETAAAAKLAPKILPDLAEITYGEWDGMSWQQIEDRWPELASRKLQDWFGVTPPGGESWSTFEGRVERALDQILSAPLPAIVVGHEAVHAVISFKQRYGELIELRIGAGDPATA
jgi:alpha-ribazole phosphatase